MNKRSMAIGLIIICTVLTTAAQLSFKLGSTTLDFSLENSLFNIYLVIGLVFYGMAAVLFIFALRLGELSVLYPLWSLSFVWVTLASMFLLKETISFREWLGIGAIVTGVSLIGLGVRDG